MDWWQDGALRPEVHAGFPLAQVREAMAEVRERRATGRVVLRP
jgi:NADPH2:quinone reductase